MPSSETRPPPSRVPEFSSCPHRGLIAVQINVEYGYQPVSGRAVRTRDTARSEPGRSHWIEQPTTFRFVR
jgi:hypothetical protein